MALLRTGIERSAAVEHGLICLRAGIVSDVPAGLVTHREACHAAREIPDQLLPALVNDVLEDFDARWEACQAAGDSSQRFQSIAMDFPTPFKVPSQACQAAAESTTQLLQALGSDALTRLEVQ